ncbi:MAG: STAS domain-containing protein [Acidobacteria bacterium]|nr:STAS domain-containing protein [Acidobacteriota bacterium]
MKIESRTVGDIHVLDCRGKITAGDDTQVIRNTVSGILKSGGKKIVLNLADVPYIDSSGIGELVHTYNTLAGRGGQLKLLNLTKRIHESLSIMKLLLVFQVYDSEQATVAGFS